MKQVGKEFRHLIMLANRPACSLADTIKSGKHARQRAKISDTKSSPSDSTIHKLKNKVAVALNAARARLAKATKIPEVVIMPVCKSNPPEPLLLQTAEAYIRFGPIRTRFNRRRSPLRSLSFVPEPASIEPAFHESPSAHAAFTHLFLSAYDSASSLDVDPNEDVYHSLEPFFFDVVPSLKSVVIEQLPVPITPTLVFPPVSALVLVDLHSNLPRVPHTAASAALKRSPPFRSRLCVKTSSDKENAGRCLKAPSVRPRRA
ncbi:hypothetical protein GGX14DRAFT_463176 [Mycena pura]|uniref:Uncharacterized protein n=1 Tax=Mycena pura TaxID=153505 RepID=A0AAD6V5A2_9AGAR|nr:hypothetical protein GGX14DRAFT_463176 [Mycena pura]